MASKVHQVPTVFEPKLVQVEPGVPTVFRWPAPNNPQHWIHFLTVARGERLLAGVYLRTTQWPYPRLSDLPYYVHDPLHTEPLEPGVVYELMYMAVDGDGWVTHLCMRQFQSTE
ncbi:MAG: hypothetical protein ACP5VE_03770 [Chthonomonadales bacterium]